VAGMGKAYFTKIRGIGEKTEEYNKVRGEKMYARMLGGGGGKTEKEDLKGNDERGVGSSHAWGPSLQESDGPPPPRQKGRKKGQEAPGLLVLEERRGKKNKRKTTSSIDAGTKRKTRTLFHSAEVGPGIVLYTWGKKKAGVLCLGVGGGGRRQRKGRSSQRIRGHL